jgi:hypothetical protein
MSGGTFSYDQSRIRDIAETIESIILKNKVEKSAKDLKEETWRDSDWYVKYPEDKLYYNYSDEVIEKFKEAVIKLKEAYVYAQRIDWLLSGNDGEDNFLIRLQKDLKLAK